MRLTLPFLLGCLPIFISIAHSEDVCPQIFLRPDVQAAAAAIVDKMMATNARWTAQDMKIYLGNGLAGQRFAGLSRGDIYTNAGFGGDKLAICFPKFRNSLMRAEEKEKLDNENRVSEQQRVEVERNKPINVLLRSYAEYIYVKKCQLDRQGYLSVNVSDAEIDRAKTAIQNIEQKLTEANPSLDKGALWKEANTKSSDVEITNRDQCQLTVRTLENTYKALAPDAKTIRKDF